jgi:hypothetical protein
MHNAYYAWRQAHEDSKRSVKSVQNLPAVFVIILLLKYLLKKVFNWNIRRL